MDRLKEVGCRWTPLGRHVGVCPPTKTSHRAQKLVERQKTAPDGQVLPDWLTWSSYETTVGEQVFQTGEILQLPLTYYGPSIPLGPDWTYGGLTSPSPGEVISPTPTTTPSEPAVSSEQTSSLSSEVVSLDASSLSEASMSTDPGGDPSTDAADETPAIQTGAGPASPLGQVIPSLTSNPAYPTPSVIGLSSSKPITSAISSTARSTSSSTPLPTADQSKNDDLVPLLPAIIVPLLTALFIILLVVWCYRRRERSQQGYTTALGASSGGYGGWLTSSFAKRANGSGERFTSAWTQVSDTDAPPPPAGGRKKEASPVSPVSAANWASSSERSALLGFIPHHHRTSSSIDHSRPTDAVGVGKKEVMGDEKKSESKEDELEVLADQNRSLLGRLNLGLGWLSVASLTSARSRTSTSGNAQARVASGHTLERGNGGVGALGRPKDASDGGGSGTGTPGGSGSNGQSNGRDVTSSESAAAGAEVSTEQLFFRAPLDTASLSSSPSPRQGFFARWKGGSTSSKSKRSSGPSRRSWQSSHMVVEREEDEPLNQTQEGISVAMPITPSTLGEGDRDKNKKTRWDSKDKLRFPIPPSGGASSAEKESLISSHNTEYHSAESHYSEPSGPPSRGTPTPDPIVTTGIPFDKSHSNYAEPALSPFGSRESIAPAKVLAGRSPTQIQNTGTSMRDLFASSPSAPTRPSMDSGGGDRRSYVGQPIIDDTLLQAISTGRGTYAGLGGIDEFGQTIRAVSGEAPTIVSTARWSRSHESERASYHSGPSTGSSQSTGHQENLADSDEATIKSHALRGRRSQPQLIQAPMMARLTPTPVSRTSSDSGDNAPMAWTRRWGG